MNATAAFFLQNIVYVYFFYGLAFFALGLVVALETTRGSEFRFARALRPLAAFGVLHGFHEWFEMFQIFAANQADAGTPHWLEALLILLLVFSFLALLAFGVSLLPDAERRRHLSAWRVAALGGIWAAGVVLVALRYQPTFIDLLDASDVLARYALGIPSALLACWALLRERRDFHARGMSAYGRDLLWAALAFFVYGVAGQLFTRPSLLYPSQVINTTLFLRTFGVPIQVVRGLAAIAIVVTLARALRAFDAESRIRLARANKARLEAQAAALSGQEHLVRQLVNAQEAERTRIARELHDETGQKLSALVMGLAAVENFVFLDPDRAASAVRKLREMAEGSIDELRNIMANLRPSQLDDLGLVPALRWFGQRYAERNPAIILNLALERSAQRLPPEYETVLFRITQEALTNVARHSRATRADVELSYASDAVRLRVTDNGVGFDEATLPRQGEGFGLAGIRERVALVHGQCTIESQPGAGACITVELPLRSSTSRQT